MNLFDRLFAKTVVLDNDCWEFTGARNNMGYGVIRVDGRKNLLAHRVAYDLVVDDIPDGMIVLHKCDNPACINPEHLKLGSMKDNSIDMTSKGRGTSLLDEDKVRQIRKMFDQGMKGTDIAKIFNVTKTTVFAVKYRYNWDWVL